VTEGKTAVLDTNVLLLLLVAQTDISLLKTFKRVQSFEASDISLLESILSRFQSFISTPHVLAEVSNFVDQAPPYRRSDLVQALRRYVDTHAERYEAARVLADSKEFALLGLTDTGLTHLSGESVVITVDFRLAGKIEALGGSVINFNHARSAFLLG
jgi:hypothetical protein